MNTTKKGPARRSIQRHSLPRRAGAVAGEAEVCSVAMPFRWRMRTSALLAILAAAASVSPGRAQAQEPPPTPTPAPSSADIAEARRHFEPAHALDPTAKDLVFNLGVVHEKLSDIDDALRWFELYTTMSLSPTERER